MLNTNIKVRDFKDYMTLPRTMRRFTQTADASLKKHASRFTFHGVLLAFYIIFLILSLFSNLGAEVIDEKEEPEELESDLPEVIKARVVDITQIKLEPRDRFEDSVEPQIGQSLGIYPKERLWNLPNILTPPKVDLKKLTESDNYLVSLEAYPRLPGSLLYNVIFAGDLQPMRGLINIDSQQLSDKFTKGRGEYNLNRFHTSVGYSPKSSDLDLDADIKYETKDLEWLSENKTDTARKDLTLLEGDFDWNQQLTDETQMTLNLNGDLIRISGDSENNYDEGVNLKLNLDLSTYWPFINPISFGGGMEYFSADSEYFSEKREAAFPTFRIYAKNHYSALGPFVFNFSGEFVSIRERSPRRVRNDQGEDKTKPFFNPAVAITTKFSEKVILQTRLNHSIIRTPLSELYFYQDYIALNPFLRTPKSWNALLVLKYQDIIKDMELKISGFAKKVDDLVVLKYSQNSEVSKTSEFSQSMFWYPDNINAILYGGEFSFGLNTDKFDIFAKYTHEIQEPDSVEHIPYRPSDLLELDLIYKAKYGINVEFGGKFCGPRYFESSKDETLNHYFIGRTKLSKNLGKYVIIFIGMQFGEYEPLKDYKFSESFVDFGLKLTK